MYNIYKLSHYDIVFNFILTKDLYQMKHHAFPEWFIANAKCFFALLGENLESDGGEVGEAGLRQDCAAPNTTVEQRYRY